MASEQRKPLLAGDYIDELNRRLATRALFEDGMRFVNMPLDRNGVQITGIDWEGARFHQALFLEVAQEVARSYELQPGPGDAASSDTFDGFLHGEHLRDGSGELFRYTVRFSDGAEPHWQAHVSRNGERIGTLEGRLQRNALGGDALKGAVTAAVVALIDVMDLPGPG